MPFTLSGSVVAEGETKLAHLLADFTSLGLLMTYYSAEMYNQTPKDP